LAPPAAHAAALRRLLTLPPCAGGIVALEEEAEGPGPGPGSVLLGPGLAAAEEGPTFFGGCALDVGTILFGNDASGIGVSSQASSSMLFFFMPSLVLAPPETQLREAPAPLPRSVPCAAAAASAEKAEEEADGRVATEEDGPTLTLFVGGGGVCALEVGAMPPSLCDLSLPLGV